MSIRKEWLKLEEMVSDNGIVVAKHPLAAKAGIQMLKKGGNAVDAAVATSFAIFVVEFYESVLAGGGYGQIFITDMNKPVQVDFTCAAPHKAKPDMFELDLERPRRQGYWWRAVKNDANYFGYKSIAVPGNVAGLCTMLERYGTMKLRDVMKPAIKYAEEGFENTWQIYLSTMGKWNYETGDFWPKVYAEYHRKEAAKLFLKDGYLPYNVRAREVPGDIIVQKDLAESFRKIARDGSSVFYKGEIAKAMVSDIQKNGGLLDEEDLAKYEPKINEAWHCNYRGYDIFSATPGGGAAVIETLNLLEDFDLTKLGHNTAKTLHLYIEASKLAFADYFKYMGDLDFVQVPFKLLESKKYLKKLRKRIDHEKASKGIKPGEPWKYENFARTHESVGTTSLVVVDKDRNMVSLSHSSGGGTGFPVPGTGFLLSTYMSGFNPEPGTPMSIAPGKKLSHRALANTIILHNGEPFMATAARGGYYIITATIQTIMNVIDHGMGIQKACESPRVSVTPLAGVEPDKEQTIYINSSISEDVVKKLKEMGHRLVVVNKRYFSQACPDGILIDPKTGRFHGGTDPKIHYEAVALGY